MYLGSLQEEFDNNIALRTEEHKRVATEEENYCNRRRKSSDSRDHLSFIKAKTGCNVFGVRFQKRRGGGSYEWE